MSLICGDVLFDSRGVAEADVLVSCQFVHEVHDLQSEAAADVIDPLLIYIDVFSKVLTV